MWIVTCNAGEASIALSPTPAALKSIRGETNGLDASVGSDNIPPSTVTCTAKIDGFTRTEVSWVEYESRCFTPRFSQRNVGGSRAVAPFAGDALHELRRIKVAVAARGCRVTSKAQDLVRLGNRTSGRKIRHNLGLARGNGKTEATNKTDPAFIQVSVLPIYVSLTTPAATKSPHQR